MIVEIQESDRKLFELVRQLKAEPEESRSRELLAKIGEYDPFSVKTAYFEGILFQDEGDYKKSLEKFYACITKSIVYKESGFGFLAQIEAGYSHIKLYEYDSFLEVFENYLSKFPANENVITLSLIAANRMIEDKYFNAVKIIDFYLDREEQLDNVYHLEFLLLKGLIGLNNNNVFFAKDFFVKAIQRAEEISDENLKCRIYANYGVYLEITGKDADAKKYYHSAKLLSQNIENFDVEAEIEANLGIIRYNEKDFKSAIFHFKRTLKLYERMGSPSKIARFNANIGFIYEKEGKFKTARNYYENSIRIFNETGDMIQAANIHDVLGEMFFRNSSFAEAEKHFNIAMQIHSDPRFGNSLLRLVDFGNIARVFLQGKKYDHALEVIRSALELASDMDQLQEKGKFLAMQGMTHLKMGDLDLAEKYIQEAEPIYSEFKNLDQSKDIHAAYAEVYFRKKSYSQALRYARLAYDQFNLDHRAPELSSITDMIAEIHVLQNNHHMAHEYTDIAIRINKDIENYAGLCRNYANKSELYRKENDTKNANIFKSMAYQLKRDRNLKD